MRARQGRLPHPCYGEPRHQRRRTERDGGCARRPGGDDPRGERARRRAGTRRRHGGRADRQAHARPRAARRDRDCAACARRPSRSGRRNPARLNPSQWAPADPEGRPDGRRRNDLRSPAERHGGCRGARAQVGQRGGASRGIGGGRVERGHRGRAALRARLRRTACGRRPEHRRLRSRGRPGAHERAGARRRVGAEGRSRTDPGGGDGVDRARDRDRRGQLPRLPRRVRAPRAFRRDHRELQDPPRRRLQRGRDPPGASGRGAARPTGGDVGARAGRGHAPRGRRVGRAGACGRRDRSRNRGGLGNGVPVVRHGRQGRG